jgi:DNA polymerase
MMDLTPRQRAMLVEMRVPIWWPEAIKAPLKAPTEAPAEAPAHVPADVPADVPTDAPASPRASPATTTKKALPVRQSGLLSWRLESPQALYVTHSSTAVNTGGCLIIMEAFWAADKPPADWLLGPDRPAAGHLLDNLLHAAQWHQNTPVSVLGLRAASGTTGSNTAEESEAASGRMNLAEYLSQWAPKVVLLMGRVAAQQALQTSEPLGKLRGHLQVCHGLPAVVTLDVPSLLRHPADKGRVWADLGLALPFMKP